MSWTPPPEPVTWSFTPPLAFGSASYATCTLRAPTPADVLKATAVRGESGLAVTLRLIAAISAEGIPYEALLLAPSWQIDQMSSYFEAFSGAQMPGPLAAWLNPPKSPADTGSPAA